MWSSATVTPFFAGRTNVSGDAGIPATTRIRRAGGRRRSCFRPRRSQRRRAAAHGQRDAGARRGELLLQAGVATTSRSAATTRWNVVDVRRSPIRADADLHGRGDGRSVRRLPARHAERERDRVRQHRDALAGRVAGRLRERRLARPAEHDAQRGPAMGIRLALYRGFRASRESRRRAGFGAVAPVLATDPMGALTGQRYPASLIRPDKHGLEPRVGVSWRPSLARRSS